MPEWYQASTYRTDDFLRYLRAYYRKEPCLLCSTVHRLYIHCYIGRLIRDPASERNVEIVICVIICWVAKSNGRQYTKRMLPPFVTPECNITLEHTVRMVKAMPEGRIDYAYAGSFLGTFCKRTIHRHYLMLRAYTETAVSFLGEYLARAAAFIELPGKPPYERWFALFLSLTQAVYQERIQRSGITREPPADQAYLHPVYVREKSRDRRYEAGDKPLNLVSSIRWYFDTS